MKLDITPVNREVRKALDSISRYDVKSFQRIEKALENGVKSIESAAERRVPTRSGGLKKSIFSKTNKAVLEGYVGVKMPHAHLIEFGVKEKVIDMSDPSTLAPKPKRAEAKTYKKAMNVSAAGPGGGRNTGFAKRIKIPSRPRQPFMQPAFEEERAKIVKSLEEAVQP